MSWDRFAYKCGQCVAVDYEKIPELAGYHPREGQQYSACTFLMRGHDKFIRMFPVGTLVSDIEQHSVSSLDSLSKGSWSTEARNTMKKMKLRLIETPNDYGQPFLQASNINIGKIRDWQLHTWDIVPIVIEFEGQYRDALEDILTWRKRGSFEVTKWSWVH